MFGTDAPFLVDLFLLLTVLVIPVMLYAVVLVRAGNVRAHGIVMTTSFIVFLVGVIAFEIQVRLGEPGPSLAKVPLVIHLCFSVPGLLLWIYQMATAKRALTEPAGHRKRGKTLLGLLVGTAVTGAWVYVATF